MRYRIACRFSQGRKIERRKMQHPFFCVRSFCPTRFLFLVDTANLRQASPLRTITSSYNADNYVRDNLGRATTIQNILGTFAGQQFTFHQSFNAVDQRTELRAVHGNKNDFRNTYAYDNLRRLTQIVQTGQPGSAPVVDKRVSFEYNTQGLRSKLS